MFAYTAICLSRNCRPLAPWKHVSSPKIGMFLFGASFILFGLAGLPAHYWSHCSDDIVYATTFCHHVYVPLQTAYCMFVALGKRLQSDSLRSSKRSQWAIGWKDGLSGYATYLLVQLTIAALLSIRRIANPREYREGLTCVLFEFATVVVIAFAGVLRHIIADKLPSVGLEAVRFSKHRSVSKIQLLVFCVTMF